MAGCQNPAINFYQCPHIKEWSLDQQHKILEAEKTLPESSPLIFVMIDYARLRNEARECIK